MVPAPKLRRIRAVLRHLVLVSILLLTAPPLAISQNARISEEIRTLATYPFSEPNPVPILTRDERLYPYHSFEGYSAESTPQKWRVVKLENELIEVFVLPEVGGKVWGAVVKKTGHEFIYRNEVMKFRNISLRGPWTSGGIEFNFGVIGHTPATATPVDYLLRENEDGSVSCFVGAMDLPSRTQWRVEIRLPADAAYFETNALWFNPTPLEQPYYNWMTAAAFAQDDLEMAIPGDSYLKHSGEEKTWPEDDQGRYLPLYDNNRFEGHKSYHVVGELNDFFGGYYLDDDYGFGHWARYEDLPGQKLWLWALSRQGGVWEDLLTDTDGQYVEFQAGRLFVQYSPDPHVNPITEASFDPMSASQWTETWFPLEGIGGLTDASRDGALHTEVLDGQLKVSVNAFRPVSGTLRIWVGDDIAAEIPAELEPLEPFHTSVELAGSEHYRVQLEALDLDYDSDPAGRLLSRPFATAEEAIPTIPAVDRLVHEARELLKGRRYASARELFERALEAEPWNHDALLGWADLDYRAGLYEQGLEAANRALQLDAYDARANFIAGTLYRALGQVANARDAFGWAARSTGYRSAANAQLAELMIGQEQFAEAERYARLAIDFDRHSIPGWRALAIIGRKTVDDALAAKALRELRAVDPLHHFAASEEGAASLKSSLGGEYPDQTVLELAVGYAGLGMSKEALVSLEAGSGGAVLSAWRAFLSNDPAALPANPDPAFEFPFRHQTLPVLAWAADHGDSWVWSYLRALNLWAVGRTHEAAALMSQLGDRPDYGPFYVARSHLSDSNEPASQTADLQRAVALDSDNRLLHIYLIRHLQEQEDHSGALKALEAPRGTFAADFNLALLEARSLIQVGRADEAVEILSGIRVLPSENSRQSHSLWEQAHTAVGKAALEAGDYQEAAEHFRAALEWPESLGQGRPYEPDDEEIRALLRRAKAAGEF
jgi:tetratricopeptide (TPR) repeat protein